MVSPHADTRAAHNSIKAKSRMQQSSNQKAVTVYVRALQKKAFNNEVTLHNI